MNTRHIPFGINRPWRAALLACLSALLCNQLTARPDYRNLTFAAHPYPAVQEGLHSLTAEGAAENRIIRDFLSFEKFIPVMHGRNSTAMDIDLQETAKKQIAAINKQIEEAGPFNPALEKELVTLAHLYQDTGEHTQALNIFSQALQVNKISNGLFHDDQIPLIESTIQSHLALGEYDKVNEKLEYLIYLHQKFYGRDSTEMIKPLATKVAWDMYYFEQHALQGNAMGMREDSLISGFTPMNMAENAPVGILVQTQQLIIKAIQILVNARDFSNPFLHKFEQQLIETYFYQAYHDGQARSSQHIVSTLEGSFLASDPFDYTKANFQNGENAYKRLLAYLEKGRQSEEAGNTTQYSLEYVVTTIGLGDWYMLFNRMEESREQYSLARELLEQGDFSEQDKQYLLHPEVPRELPAFGGSPLFSAVNDHKAVKPGEFLGYVDVSLELSPFGRVKNYRTLDQSPETPKYITKELEWRVRDSQFRPYLADARQVADGPVSVRYYYRY